MKYLIQFSTGRYFTDKSPMGGDHVLQGSVFSTGNLLEAKMYDNIKIAKKVKGVSGTKIISITTKDLFCLKLGAT